MNEPKAPKEQEAPPALSSSPGGLDDIDEGWDLGDESSGAEEPARPQTPSPTEDVDGKGDAGDDGLGAEPIDEVDQTLDVTGGVDSSDEDGDKEAVESPASEPQPQSPEPGQLDMAADVYGMMDVGQVREHNEDNFLIADLTGPKRQPQLKETTPFDVGPGGLLFAVCDGMGGAAAGEVASQMATDIIFERMASGAGHRDHDQLAIDIIRSLEDAGRLILAESKKNRACRGMGTTATVAACVDGRLMLGQVGDSRAYLMRGDRLVQVTRDQSLVNQLIEAGQLTEEEAENFEHSNIILQALGTAEVVQVDLTSVELCRGDVLMMCSDGLSGMIRDLAIHTIMADETEPRELSRVLIERANEAGGHDNITVIIATFDGEDLPEPTDQSVESLCYHKYALPPEYLNKLTAGIDDRDTVDETPHIEILGEFEVPEDVDWEEVLGIKRRGVMGHGESSTFTVVVVLLTVLLLVAWLMNR